MQKQTGAPCKCKSKSPQYQPLLLSTSRCRRAGRGTSVCAHLARARLNLSTNLVPPTSLEKWLKKVAEQERIIVGASKKEVDRPALDVIYCPAPKQFKDRVSVGDNSRFRMPLHKSST
eukprot:1155800-Pelagomonas_calceolata.AAC.2